MFLEFHLMCFLYIFTELFCLDVIALMLFEYENNFWCGNNLEDLLEFCYFSEVNFLEEFLGFSVENAWNATIATFLLESPFKWEPFWFSHGDPANREQKLKWNGRKIINKVKSFPIFIPNKWKFSFHFFCHSMQAKKPSKDESNDNEEESRLMGIVDGFWRIDWDYAWDLKDWSVQ